MSDESSELTAELYALASAAGDMTPAFQRAATVFRSAVEEHFAGGGAGWESWSDDYADLPFAYGGPGRSMLVREGELLASLASPASSPTSSRSAADGRPPSCTSKDAAAVAAGACLPVTRCRQRDCSSSAGCRSSRAT
ncbi:MAG: hypothetical protein BRC31_04655 [Actinobacteria bacterium QS_5_72_10]|nr:MAG: hypothetical protein BRC31_04655 [Actinobacteria bacterium QS_5_72_10]